ncbi:MAG: hypothetical protein JWP55_1685 [Mycobacterium sp.]|nr:hypothetical protein [Mycobacterium sp.]
MELGTGLGQRPVGQYGRQRVAHRGQVEAVAEVLARAGQHDRPDVGVGVERGERDGQLRPERGPHGVALAWADQRHLRDVPVDVEGEGFEGIRHAGEASGLPGRPTEEELAHGAAGDELAHRVGERLGDFDVLLADHRPLLRDDLLDDGQLGVRV